MADDSLNALAAELRLPDLANAVDESLRQAADPERARPLMIEILRAAGRLDGALQRIWSARRDEIMRIVTCVGGAAPFLASWLIRHPAWLIDLASDDLRVPRTPADYDARLTLAFAHVTPAAQSQTLRLFKYYELTRITVRDLSPALVTEARGGETLAELSHLADALLARAYACVSTQLAAASGAAQWRTADGSVVPLSFCVLALGKLGSEELNYSSDVDLIYIYGGRDQGDGELRDGPSSLSPEEYFTRLAQAFGKLVKETTADGFLYRIDLDLRPEGTQGPLVVSSDMLTSYYELWAATWEKAACMKARPVAGDIDMGWRILRALEPIIFRTTTDYAGVAAIKEMKSKVEQAKAIDSAADIKSGPGGIRDVEFIAQALQLLHGGRIPQVRARSTQSALEALAQVEVLPPQDARQLLVSYRFLRRVENCLQMEAERQVHKLPADPAGATRLARAMGFLDPSAVADFDTALNLRRQQVRGVVSALFPDEGSEPILELFARNAPRLFRTPANARMIERLAADFAHEIAESTDPRRAMTNLERFIQGVGVRPFYYELLVDRPELVPRLAALFATSEYLSDYFAKFPRLIEPIFSDPTVLLLTRQQLEAELRSVAMEVEHEAHRDAVERGLAILRLFHHRALVNVGLLDLVGEVTRAAVERSLTDIAEVCVAEALRFARDELRKRGPEPASIQHGEFLVVGMGKLGSRELTYGSDLDVIFLYDVEGGDDLALLEAQEYYVRLAQKAIWALQTRTPEGLCYEIDARLRPSGNQGMLVTSRASFAQYHGGMAQVWERQALLRARAVAGGTRLAQAFASLRVQILAQSIPEDAGKEIHRVRLRMEKELANESTGRHDFKAGRGGLLDVESVVQFLQLRHGPTHRELFEVDDTAGHLARLSALGLLAHDDAQELIAGWDFLQRLSSRLRIVENRSISDLDEDRGDLDTLARRLGYVATQRDTGARRALLEDYRRHTSAIRTVYLRIMGVV